MSIAAMSLSGLSGSSTISTKDVLGIGDKPMVGGITTEPIITDVVKNGNVSSLTLGDWTNKPSIHKTMDSMPNLVNPNTTVSINGSTSPNPAPMFSDSDLMKKAVDGLGGRLTDNQHTGIGDFHNTDISRNNVLVKGLCFYTDNRIDEKILEVVKIRLKASMNGYSLVTVSQKPLGFGRNIVLDLKPSHLAMAKQQLAGIEALNTDIIFMVEHDVLYPACHFDFVPPRKDVFYYDLNWWKVRDSDGQALHFKAKQVSGLCAYKNILIEYFKNRIRMIESGEIGGRRHFEPGSRYGSNDPYNKLTSHGFDTWFSKIPYVDIRHQGTVSRNVFDPSGYRGQVVDWTPADEIPSWGITKGRFNDWLQEVKDGKYPVNS